MRLHSVKKADYNLYDLELLQQLNSVKFFWAVSYTRCLYEINISRTILIPIIIREPNITEPNLT